MGGKKNSKKGTESTLSTLMGKVASSPRFSLLQHLKMKNLSFDGLSFAPVFGDDTLGDVVSLSEDEIAALPHMTEACMNALVGLLITYSEPSEETSGAGTIIPLRPRVESDLAPIKRGEAEAKLQDFLIELKKAPAEKLTRYTLKNYWEKSFPNAPFEEVLTFQQLLELGYENLTRKRTLHTEKILAIVGAGEKFLSDIGLKTSSSGVRVKQPVSFILKKALKTKIPKDLLLKGEPLEGRIKKLITSGETYIALANEELVGAFILDIKAKEISLLVISPSFRERGYGKALLSEAIRKVNEKKWKKIKFKIRNSATEGISFLQKNGFKQISIEKDFYTKQFKNEELIENGVKAKDLLCFEMVLS